MLAWDGCGMGLGIASDMDEIHTSVKTVVLQVSRRHVLKLGCSDDARWRLGAEDSGYPLPTSGDITNRLLVVLCPTDAEVMYCSTHVIVRHDLRYLVLSYRILVAHAIALR